MSTTLLSYFSAGRASRPIYLLGFFNVTRQAVFAPKKGISRRMFIPGNKLNLLKHALECGCPGILAARQDPVPALTYE
jgi:hypothetical protein